MEKTWRQIGKSGEQEETIKIDSGSGGSTIPDIDPVPDKGSSGKSQYEIVKVEKGVKVEGQVRNIFDTITYIDKADRKLWRINSNFWEKRCFFKWLWCSSICTTTKTQTHTTIKNKTS